MKTCSLRIYLLLKALILICFWQDWIWFFAFLLFFVKFCFVVLVFFFVLVYTCSPLRFTSISRFWEGKTGDLGDEREKSQGKSSEKKQQYWDIIHVWTKHIDAHHTSVPLLITKFSIATIKVHMWPGIPVLSESHLLSSLFHKHWRSWVSYNSAHQTVPPKPNGLDPISWMGSWASGRWIQDITRSLVHIKGVVSHCRHLIQKQLIPKHWWLARRHPCKHNCFLLTEQCRTASSQTGKHGEKGKAKKGQMGSQGTQSPEHGTAKGQRGAGEGRDTERKSRMLTLRETAINPLRNYQIQIREPSLTGFQDLCENSLDWAFWKYLLWTNPI